MHLQTDLYILYYLPCHIQITCIWADFQREEEEDGGGAMAA